jgi:hypothetical protein
MAKKRKEASPSGIKLRQPDRTGPTQETLLDIAQKRNLFAQAKEKEDANKRAAGKAIRSSDEEGDDEEAALSPTAERIMETLLWTVSLAMLHFTLDVLVQHQYSMNRVQWPKVCTRAVQAWMGAFLPPPTVLTQSADLTAFVNSVCALVLSTSSAFVEPDDTPRSASAVPEWAPASHLLRHERLGRLLSHSCNQRVRVPGRHEAGPASGLPLGLVGHRVGPDMGSSQPRRRRLFSLVGRIFD